MRGRFIPGIKGKFVLTAALIVAISSIIWGSWAWRNENRLLYDRLVSNARSMATSLRTPIINALVYEEMGVIEEGGLLDNFVEEIVANKDFPALYAFVTDDKGKVLAHNHYMEYGHTITDDLTREALMGDSFISRMVLDAVTHENILDVAMPLSIYGKSWGTLRIGISMKPLERELYMMGFKVVSFSALFFLAGTLLFYFVGQTITRPIQNLAGAMSEINPQTLTIELPEPRNDEIGVLQESFREMLERLRRSEGERERMVVQLIQSEKMASIGKIVAGVAHEVNNPLATIGTCIYNLEQENGAPNRNLDIIKQGAERIRRIVSQLNDFSRAGSLDLQQIDSSRFFTESAEFAKIALSKHSVRLVTEDDCHLSCPLSLDKGKMQQVILNLLINASDASQSGDVVLFKAYCKDSFYHIEVRDNGCGIQATELDRIFDIFYTTKQAGKGTGIGLAVCKSIVEMHGGSIGVTSSSGETVFTVVIPQNTPEVCSAEIQAIAG
ncbi:MAG: ATP-binding protein [Desulfuromonadaceae bacterium]|nr:ATP-binding protein [Desulfuromonadaceae bacterium]